MEMVEVLEEIQEVWSHIHKFEDTVSKEIDGIKIEINRMNTELESVINLVQNLNLPETLPKLEGISDLLDAIGSIADKNEEIEKHLSGLDKLISDTRDMLMEIKDRLKIQEGKTASLGSTLTIYADELSKLKKGIEEKKEKIVEKIDEIKRSIKEYMNEKDERLDDLERRIRKLEEGERG